jgi:hypothetical protein
MSTKRFTDFERGVLAHKEWIVGAGFAVTTDDRTLSQVKDTEPESCETRTVAAIVRYLRHVDDGVKGGTILARVANNIEMGDWKR